MATPPGTPGPDPDARPDEARDEHPQPDLLEALREIAEGGRTSLGAAGEVARSLRSLVVADVALARSAAGHAAVAGGVALIGGVTAWLFLMGTLVALLRGLGLSWWLAMLLPGVVSLVIAAIGLWMATRYFGHTRLQATRRQLALLGIGGLSQSDHDPDPARSAAGGAHEAHPGDAPGDPARDHHGAETTPR